MDTTRCTLGEIPGKYRACKPTDCPTCGWNAEEMARRLAYIRQHGLTPCADVKRRLVIRHPSAEENAAPGTGTPEDGEAKTTYLL